MSSRVVFHNCLGFKSRILLPNGKTTLRPALVNQHNQYAFHFNDCSFVQRFIVQSVRRPACLKDIKTGTLEKSNQAKASLLSLWRKYGYTGLVVYFSLYVTTLAGCFGALHFNIITTESLEKLASISHLHDYFDVNTTQLLHTFRGKIVLAWLCAKIAEPLRLFLTLSLTPSVARLVKLRQKVP